MEIAPVQWCETRWQWIIHRICKHDNIDDLPWTSEKIFSMLLWVARVTFTFSDISTNFSPNIAKSKTLYIRRWSHRPSFRSRSEKMVFSVTFPSAMIYSRHEGEVIIRGDLGTREVVCSFACPQSEVWRSRRVRNTLEIVNAKTLTIEKLRKRHDGDYGKGD